MGGGVLLKPAGGPALEGHGQTMGISLKKRRYDHRDCMAVSIKSLAAQLPTY